MPFRLVVTGTHPFSPVLAESIAASVAAGEQPPTVLIRRQRPYVLLGPGDRRLPDLPAGIRYLQRQGLPVFERVAGGSAVLLDEGCLSFAAIRPSRDLTRIQRNYHDLCAGVFAALASLGLQAAFGEAPGSFCPGPYDIVVAGRKVAGIAQAVRGGAAAVSGMLLVSQDTAAATALLNAFYAAAGEEKGLDPAAVTNLSEQVGRPLSVELVEEHLRRGFDVTLGLTEGALTGPELERAQALLQRRRAG